MSTAEQLQSAVPAVPDPDATFMDVTPVMAERWMQKNQHNRSFSRHVASKYVDDIRSGSFQGLNGDTINLSVDGLLIRLSLVVEGSGRIDPTQPELDHHLAANPSFRDAAEVAKDYGRLIECAPSLGMYGYWRMAQISTADAFAFWSAATTKVGMHNGDPILALLYRLSDVRIRKQHLERKVLLSLIFRTWNARRKGQVVSDKGLRINTKGGQPYPIPELI